MTTKTELLEFIQNGENSGIEFKRDVIVNHALARELVAFSNLRGGMVLLGVEDDGSVSGITRLDLEEWVMTTCREKIRPGIIPFFEIVRNVDSGRDVAIVHVIAGLDVHSLWHNNHENYYLRVGTQCREPTREELSRLFQQRSFYRAELQAVSGATLADLDRRRLHNYFEQIRQQEIPPDEDDIAWRTLLINTELMSNEGVTVAAILLFGVAPNRFLPHAGIDAVAFPGTEKDYQVRERGLLRGAMTPLLDASDMVVENGIVEQALQFVRKNTSVETTLNGGRRTENFDYPPEVLREAIVNAIIHRDYLLSSTDIEMSIYSDRLEIISPGRLPNGITPDRMRTGCRAARNQLLKDIMRDYKYLEHMGMGIPRKIIRGMQAHNGTTPELVEDGEQFILRLFI